MRCFPSSDSKGESLDRLEAGRGPELVRYDSNSRETVKGWLVTVIPMREAAANAPSRVVRTTFVAFNAWRANSKWQGKNIVRSHGSIVTAFRGQFPALERFLGRYPRFLENFSSRFFFFDSGQGATRLDSYSSQCLKVVIFIRGICMRRGSILQFAENFPSCFLNININTWRNYS